MAEIFTEEQNEALKALGLKVNGTQPLNTLNIHKLTQAQYETLLSNGKIDENAIYMTPNEAFDKSQFATVEQVNAKADKKHTHVIDDVESLRATLDALDLGKSDDGHAHEELYYTKTTIDEMHTSILDEAKNYVDSQIAPLARISGENSSEITDSSTGAAVNVQALINEALAQAKASGNFDGDDGRTPKKGEDYWTATDKADMVAEVLAQIPNGNEVAY